jgi:hypothetical protein
MARHCLVVATPVGIAAAAGAPAIKELVPVSYGWPFPSYPIVAREVNTSWVVRERPGHRRRWRLNVQHYGHLGAVHLKDQQPNAVDGGRGKGDELGPAVDQQVGGGPRGLQTGAKP